MNSTGMKLLQIIQSSERLVSSDPTFFSYIRFSKKNLGKSRLSIRPTDNFGDVAQTFSLVQTLNTLQAVRHQATQPIRTLISEAEFCCFFLLLPNITTVYTFSNHVTYILGLVKITHFLGLLHIFTSQPNHPNPSHLQPAKPTKPHLGSASLPHFPNHGEAPTLAMATRVGTKHLPLGVF